MSICDPSIDLDCGECYIVSRTDCGSFFVQTGLTPLDSYFLILQDENQNVFTESVAIEADGTVLIDPSVYSKGVINKYGNYFFVLSLTNDPVTPVTITISLSTYNCIWVNFNLTDPKFCGC